MSDHFGETADYIRRHNVIYETPPAEGWEGFPLGNGSLGGPLWTNSHGFVFQVNHTDSYELPDPENLDEPWAILRSCGRLTMEYAVPFQDWLYLRDFQGRLSLSDATADFVSRSAFGDFQTLGYVLADSPVVVFDCRADYSATLGGNGAPVRINLEHWGSRVCGWWYTRLSGDAGAGLGDCSAYVDGQDICIDIPFRGVSVSLRCRVIGAESSARVVHGHQASIEVASSARQDFQILLACVTSHSVSDPAEAARAAIEAAAAKSDRLSSHREWWRAYWNRSFLKVGNDYYENLYYLHLYLMGCSARGKFPPLFNGGLWIWNHDVRNWVNPHHWNEQQPHWCLAAANRVDLLMPYLETYSALRYEGLKMAERKGYKGMLWSEMHDFFGRQLSESSPSMMDNFTPAAQISLFFWWHYQFTGDIVFLGAKGYPFLRSVAEFYVNWISWNDVTQQYELPLASTYEDERRDDDGNLMRFTNSITNLGMIRAVLSALIEASTILDLDEEPRATWQHILSHLPPFITNGRDVDRGVILGSGLLNGREVPEKEDHNHGPLFCPIVPAGVIGLKDAGTELLSAARNTLVTYHSDSNAITPTVMVAARLGLAKEAVKRMDSMVRNLQQFSTGMFFNLDHWFIYSRRAPVGLSEWGHHDMADFQRDYIVDRTCRFSQVSVSETDDRPAHFADVSTKHFTQPGLESLGHFAAGIQEMLLQSHEGEIRVFPAVPDDWEGAFSLLAAGGFEIASHRVAFQPPSFISITSRLGGLCAIVSPWEEGARLSKGDAKVIDQGSGRIAFETLPGGLYTLIAKGASSEETAIHYESLINNHPKRYKEATIGTVREF